MILYYYYLSHDDGRAGNAVFIDQEIADASYTGGTIMCLLFLFLSVVVYVMTCTNSWFRPHSYLPNNIIIIITFSLLSRSLLVYHYYYYHRHHRGDYYRLQCPLSSHQLPPNSENSVDRFLTVRHDNNNMFEERWWWRWRWRCGRVTRIAIARWPTNL